MKISIVVPVYNEFPTLSRVIDRIRTAPLPAGCTREIVVVDDGSTDGTEQVLRQHADAGLVIAHHSARNLGKGTALRVGFSLASGDVILTQDGDLEYDPCDYARLVEPILSGEADIVYGSRFLKRARCAPDGMAWKNRLANRILTTAANLLYDARITDEATAYKAFAAPVLRTIRLECRRFEFCPEATAKACRLGYRIHEVPISYNGRTVEDGKKIRARDGFQAVWTLLRYRFAPRSRLLTGVPTAPRETGLLTPDTSTSGAASHPAPAARPSASGSNARVWRSRQV